MTNDSFVLVRSEQVPDFDGEARLYRHVATGLEVLKIVNKDENRAFAIGFRTPLTSSDGRAHILEHSVLGGSKNFPLKDPFFEMIKSSLYTYMNAFTMPDQTVYPVASVHPQDFLNLMGAYLDAVFLPDLERMTFMREGWHLRRESPDGPLSYGGIVFNEMKGNYADPGYHFWKAMIAGLYPDTQYQFDSGGDPEAIPNLTYDQFIEFYKTHYQPSNAVAFLYGAGDTDAELELLSKYLKNYSKSGPVKESINQPLQRFPSTIEREFPVQSNEDLDQKAWVSLVWSVSPLKEPLEAMKDAFLGHILIGFPGAPLYHALEKKQFGKAVRGGYIGYTYDGLMQVTIEGTDISRSKEIEQFILDQLTELSVTGISPDVVEAALNSYEFSLREANNGNERGIHVSFDLLKPWLYGADPFTELQGTAALKHLQETLKTDPTMITERIKRHLLNNRHRVTVLLRPNPELQAQRDAREQARLEQELAKRSPQEVEKLVQEAEALEARRMQPDSPEALARLPRIHSHSVSKKPRLTRSAPSAVDERFLVPDLDAHGILYHAFAFDISHIPLELLPYAQLCARLTMRCDTDKRSQADLSTRLESDTGGVSINTTLFTHRATGQIERKLKVEGSCLTRQQPKFLSLVSEIISTQKPFEKQRVLQLVQEYLKGAERGIVNNGNAVAASRAAAGLRSVNAVANVLYGIDNLYFLRNLEKEIATGWDAVADKLHSVRNMLYHQHRFAGCVVAQSSERDAAVREAAKLVRNLSAPSLQPAELNPTLPQGHEGWTIPSQVHYVAASLDFKAAGVKEHGSIRVFNNLLWGGHLLEQVRFKGGAYGCGCSFDAVTGLFGFSSYRDPELDKTLAVYRDTANWVRNLEIDAGLLDRNIIAAIRPEDAPQSVEGEGMNAFGNLLSGYTDEMRERNREEILTTSVPQLKGYADYFDAAWPKARIVALGPKATLEKQGSLAVRDLV